MNKRPALMFYPADWLKDTDLQMCSMNTIGVWINIICRMWESKEEGILRGKSSELALLIGAKPREFKRFLEEAQKRQFCDVLQNVTESYTVVTIINRRIHNAFLERERAKKGMRQTRAGRSYENVTPLLTVTSTSTLNTYTLDEVKTQAVLVGLSEKEARIWYDHFKAQKFVFANGQPIDDLPSALRRWRNNNYKFKDNKDGGNQNHSTQRYKNRRDTTFEFDGRSEEGETVRA